MQPEYFCYWGEKWPELPPNSVRYPCVHETVPDICSCPFTSGAVSTATFSDSRIKRSHFFPVFCRVLNQSIKVYTDEVTSRGGKRDLSSTTELLHGSCPFYCTQIHFCDSVHHSCSRTNPLYLCRWKKIFLKKKLLQKRKVRSFVVYGSSQSLIGEILN